MNNNFDVVFDPNDKVFSWPIGSLPKKDLVEIFRASRRIYSNIFELRDGLLSGHTDITNAIETLDKTLADAQSIGMKTVAFDIGEDDEFYKEKENA